MIVFLNGKFVSEDQAVIPVCDRSFLYGDGLFETMRICKGKPFRWEQHLERFERGAKFLKIKIPFTRDAIRAFVTELVARNERPEALVRMMLSRGVGLRGYSPCGAERPTMVMSLYPAPVTAAPVQWKLLTSSFRLPANEALAQFKTCNKLPQILARAEADEAGADEALLLNTDGQVVEAASSNLFWVQADGISTPPLASGILAGVTRGVVMELCRGLGIRVQETNISPGELREVQGIFCSLSSVGIAEGIELDGHSLNRSALVTRVRDAYAALLSDF